MKKRLFPLALALLMALSLFPTTAFAATNADPYLYDVQFRVSDGAAPPSQVTASYQVRDVQDNNTGTYVYGAVATTNPTNLYVLSSGISISISDLRYSSGTPTDMVVFYAWSDPDNDGIYDERVFSTRESERSVVPLTEQGPFASTDNVIYSDFQTPLLLGFKPELSSTTYSVTFTTDQLCDLFGPNTLLVISVVDTQTYTSRMNCTVLLTGKSVPAAPSFTDVPTGEWYADPVAWAVEKGITNGTEPDKFSPGQNCTQAQILTFLYRAARNGGTATAEDMDKAINWAREKGMIDDSFKGNKLCTRSTAVNYIWQAFNKPSAKASSFTDVDANADYAAAVSWAVEKEITNGTNPDGTTFSPDEICSRGHIVTFLYRAYNN